MKKIENMENKKYFELSHDFSKGNYIKDVYYVKETDKAILIYKNRDGSIYRWIPKSLIKYGWKKDKEKPQNIFFISFFFPKDFCWEIRKRPVMLDS